MSSFDKPIKRTSFLTDIKSHLSRSVQIWTDLHHFPVEQLQPGQKCTGSLTKFISRPPSFEMTPFSSSSKRAESFLASLFGRSKIGPVDRGANLTSLSATCGRGAENSPPLFRVSKMLLLIYSPTRGRIFILLSPRLRVPEISGRGSGKATPLYSAFSAPSGASWGVGVSLPSVESRVSSVGSWRR